MLYFCTFVLRPHVCICYADDWGVENFDWKDSEGRAPQGHRQALDTFWRTDTILEILGYSNLYGYWIEHDTTR